MFSNVPIKEAMASGINDTNGGNFPQEVPIPMIEDNNITTGKGYDCYILKYVEKIFPRLP
jgi:hypothetical protein